MIINMESRNERKAERDAVMGWRYRVIADQRDVTNDCFYFDGRRRIVGLYVVGGDGNVIFKNGKIVKRWLRPRRCRLVKRW